MDSAHADTTTDTRTAEIRARAGDMRAIRSKKKCCKDRPRCKRCPVVLKRLESAGYATRLDRRTWLLEAKPKKKALRAARA